MDSLKQLNNEIIGCRRCLRLREHCMQVAATKRRAYRDWVYWGRPVTGFGDPRARMWIVGLAPGAHGANRTGRVFTGDQSGHFLYAALHRAGYANQPESTSIGDGLKLTDCYISAAVRCAPPGNKPTLEEATNCRPFIEREWDLLSRKRAILALGKFAWDAAIDIARAHEISLKARPLFGHGIAVTLRPGLTLIGSYHVSQQNTFTGKLTARMFDRVLQRCRSLCEGGV